LRTTRDGPWTVWSLASSGLVCLWVGAVVLADVLLSAVLLCVSSTPLFVLRCRERQLTHYTLIRSADDSKDYYQTRSHSAFDVCSRRGLRVACRYVGSILVFVYRTSTLHVVFQSNSGGSPWTDLVHLGGIE